MLHIQLLEWSKKPIMTSSIDKSTKSQKHQLWQPKFTQAQVHISVHSYADTSFVFILTHDALTHGVPSTLWLGSTSLHRLRGLSQRMLERQVLRWSPLSVVPGVGRSVVVHARTEGYCQSQRQSSSSSSESTPVAVPLAAVILFLVTWASRCIQLM